MSELKQQTEKLYKEAKFFIELYEAGMSSHILQSLIEDTPEVFIKFYGVDSVEDLPAISEEDSDYSEFDTNLMYHEFLVFVDSLKPLFEVQGKPVE